MKNRIREAVKSGVIGVMFVWAGAAHAIPVINGTFSLSNDDDGPYPARALIASGSFSTEGDGVLGTFINTRGLTFDTVKITAFDLVDRTPDGGFGSFAFPTEAFTFGSSFAAILANATDPTDASRVIGFHGTILSTTGPPILLALNGFSTGSPGGRGLFTITNGESNLGESGGQNIPEPSALALLGIGVLAFGVARRRRLRGA